MRWAVGLDVGGTRTKSGAVAADGRLLAGRVTPTDGRQGPAALVRTLAAEVERLAAEVGGRPRAIGLALPGAVAPGRGVVLLPGRLRGVAGFPLVARLARRTGLPVVAENDGRAALVAEHRFGAARGQRWAVSVTVGTGVGSGVLLDGRILRDPHLQFGTQLAHMVLDASNGRLCLTGARGTGEMLCSATALAGAVREALARGVPSRLAAAFARDPSAIDFRAVAQAAARGDRLCADELRLWTRRLGWLLVSAAHLYAPEVIVLGGGAMHAARQILPDLRAQLWRHLFRWPRGSAPALRVSRLRDHAGVLGAAALALDARSR